MQSTVRSTRSSKRCVTEPAPIRELQSAHTDNGQYICIECSETFNNKLELNSHRQSHVIKKQFTCSHCGRGFHHQFFLQMHERSHEDGLSITSLSRPPPGRVISTRSSKPLPQTDIIHVTAAPSKPLYRLNSKVQFKKEWNVGQEVTPTECLTRRTQGAYSPTHQRTDDSEQKTQFELRISKLSDSNVHLIDPYGNTLEILAEVFNTYTISEPEEEEDEECESPSGTSEMPAAPSSSTVLPDNADEMGASPEAEISEPRETICNDNMEEELPISCMESVSSASVSPKTVPDLCDFAEEVPSTQAPRESNTQEVACSEHLVDQPATETPKTSSEQESLQGSAKDSLITCEGQTIPEGHVKEGVNELSVVTAQTEVPVLKVGGQDDATSVQEDNVHKEDKSTEQLLLNNQEKDGGAPSPTPEKEKHLSMTISRDLNDDLGHSVSSCVKDNQELKSDQERSLSSSVIDDNLFSESKGLGDSGEVPLVGPDNGQDVTLLEDDRTELPTPVTKCVSESNEHPKEHTQVISTSDHDSLGPYHVLHADLSADSVFSIPTHNAKVETKDGSDGIKTSSQSDLKSSLSEAGISGLSKGVHEEASCPLASVDVCSSESKSLNTSSAILSMDIVDQRTVDSSNHEESSVERDISEKALISLEKQVSASIMSDTLSQIADGTMPILQEAPSPEPKGEDGLMETDLLVWDPSRKNDSISELNPDNDLGMSSLLHNIQPPESSSIEQDVNLRDSMEMEEDVSSSLRQSAENEETVREVSGVTPIEVFSLTNTESAVDKVSSHEDIQTSVQVSRCPDVESVASLQKTSVIQSGDDDPFTLLEPQAVSAPAGLLQLCDEDLSLRNFTESQAVSFNVPTLVSITSACVKAQEHVLSQDTKSTEQDAAPSVKKDEKVLENADLKANTLLEKLEGEDSGTTLCLLEPTLTLSPDLEDLSGKCLLDSEDMKDLTESDIEKNLEDPHKQYIQMSNADLTENDLADDFAGSGTILLDAPSLEEATKEDDVSVDESTMHDLSDMLSPEIQESESTEGQDDKHLGFGGPCLKCGRRVRRGRKELVWFPTCYKCRVKSKREERHSGEGTSSDFSNFHIKQEADPAQDDAFYRTVKPMHSIHSIKQESAALLRKAYKCPKCEKSFKIPELLASHMKCHTLPQCLTCGCPLALKPKTNRIPKRCHKCAQMMKQQKKEECGLGDDEDDSLDSESGSLFADEADLQNLSDNDESNLSSTELVEDPNPGSVKRGTEPFHSLFMRKHKKMNPAIRALYCTCDVVLKSGAKQPKICKNCQKPVRDQSLSKASLVVGRRVYGQTAGGKQWKKTKEQLASEPDRQNLLLGESSLSYKNEQSPDDEFYKVMEPFTEEGMSDQLVPSDGEKPHLCPECGKVFKCNRSLNLHLLSHSATQCETCGCRLQKKKRAGRWSKKCRVCRLLTKGKGLPDCAIDDELPKEKNMAPLQLKMKPSKILKSKKIQSAKYKKELNWMNMLLAVKGLTQKPRKKKELSIKSPSEEKTAYSSEPAESDLNSGTEDKAGVLKDLESPSKCEPGPSGLQISQKKILGGIAKVNRKCLYREKNIIKVEEQQLPPYMDDPLSTAVSVKEEEENQCLECNEIFPNFDLLLTHQQGHIEGEPFTCLQCPQKFSTEQYLSMHISAHAEGPPFRCLECNKTFTRRNHLGVHRRVHTGSRPYACPDCPCRFRQRGSLIIHRYTHRNLQLMMLKPYQCSVCDKSFKQKERLIIHERLHTGECPFSCKDCDKVFPSKSRLYVHRKMHRAPEASSSLDVRCKEEAVGPPFQCKNCDKICSTKASFVLHCKVHKSPPVFEQSISCEEKLEETTNETPSTSGENLDVKPEQEGHPFRCKDCNGVFSSKASFVLHRKVHHLTQRSATGSPFVCKDCGKICSTKASLVLHRKVHKSPLLSDLKANIGVPPFICKLCKKVCSTKASFVLHCKVHKVLSSSSGKILKANVEQKPLVCKKCGFVCSTKASFVLHRKIHRPSPSLVQRDGTGQQPFTCKECNKVCSTKASLVLHCKVHKVIPKIEQSSITETEVEEKPYHCKDCGKIYSTKGRLLSHMKLHGGQDMSADGAQLLNIDTEEKPFECPICHMKFTRLKILVRHKLIHGEDVISCGHCGKRFLFQKSLMNHEPICLKRSKAKILLGKEKVPKKRKNKDGSSNEESAPKKRKHESKKAMIAMQKLKNKKLIQVKKMAMKKEKSKAKGSLEKKPKKPKAEAEQDPEVKGEEQSDGNQEGLLEPMSKEKEIGKDKKPKEVAKVKKVLKKVPAKQKRQKVSSESLKKWRMIAAATVKKRKLQAVISGGKKKATVKKKGPSKAKTGGKNSKE